MKTGGKIRGKYIFTYSHTLLRAFFRSFKRLVRDATEHLSAVNFS